jgi:integrase
MSTPATERTRTRRGNGEGTVGRVPRKDGRYAAHFTLPTGKRRTVYGQSREEARQKMKAALKKIEEGLDVGAPSQTLAAFLDAWLADAAQRVRPKTLRTYQDLLRLHVIPELGTTRLDRLTAQQVAALLRAKHAAGLSPKTIAHVRATLRAALNQAVRWRLIGHNPAAAVDPPRVPRREVAVLTPEEARLVLDTAAKPYVPGKGQPERHDRHEALWVVALSLGLRQAEVLALRWIDVDLEAETLRVAHALSRIDGTLTLTEPKTARSRRTLPLPRRVRAALLAHRDRQAFARAAAGERWQEHGFVFASALGTPLQPRNVLRDWYKLLKRAGLARRPFHATRHTAASLLIADGVPLRVVMELLGHSQISTTANTYGHVFDAALREAAAAMDRALGP